MRPISTHGKNYLKLKLVSNQYNHSRTGRAGKEAMPLPYKTEKIIKSDFFRAPTTNYLGRVKFPN